MSQREKSGNTIKPTCSQESGGSRSRSKWPTLGEVAAYARLDFHARICQSPAEVKDLKERPVDSGGKPLQPLAEEWTSGEGAGILYEVQRCPVAP